MGEVAASRAIRNAIEPVGLSTAFGRLSAVSPAGDPSAVDAGLLGSFSQILARSTEPLRRTERDRDDEREATDRASEAGQSNTHEASSSPASSDVSSPSHPSSEATDVQALNDTQNWREDEATDHRLPQNVAATVSTAQPIDNARESEVAATVIEQSILSHAESAESIRVSLDDGSSDVGLTPHTVESRNSQDESRNDKDPTAFSNRELLATSPGTTEEETNSDEAAHSVARTGRGKRGEISTNSPAVASSRSNGQQPASLGASPGGIAGNAIDAPSTKVDSTSFRDVTKLNPASAGLSASNTTNMPIATVLTTHVPTTHVIGTQAPIVNSSVPEHASQAMAGDSFAGARSTEHGLASAGSERTNRSTIDQIRLIQRVSKAFQHLGRDGGEIRLRLAPPELGTLQLEMQVHERSIIARIHTDSETASAALREHLPELRLRLESLGMRIERLEVHRGVDDRGDEAWQNTDTGQHAFHHSWRERETMVPMSTERSHSADTSAKAAQGSDLQAIPPAAFEGVDIRL